MAARADGFHRLLFLKTVLTIAAISVVITSTAMASENLPARTSPIPPTTNSVPHVQIGVEAPPGLSAELLQRVSTIPGVEIRETIISLPGAKGFWINEDVTLARPEVIVGGREFAHIHPDGSLHASLSPELAMKAVKAGWATHHPWAKIRPGWEGFVMIYSPSDTIEMDTVFRLILESYDYVTGNNLATKE